MLRLLRYLCRVWPQPAPAFDKQQLLTRLRAMPADDPLWPQLLALLDAFAVTEARACASPALDDAEAHRLRGRVGMCFDLRSELEALRHEAAQREDGSVA